MTDTRASRLALLTVLVLLAGSLGACGDTWRGAKQDTGDNLKSTGQTLENAGEKVQP